MQYDYAAVYCLQLSARGKYVALNPSRIVPIISSVIPPAKRHAPVRASLAAVSAVPELAFRIRTPKVVVGARYLWGMIAMLSPRPTLCQP